MPIDLLINITIVICAVILFATCVLILKQALEDDKKLEQLYKLHHFEIKEIKDKDANK